MNPTLPKHDLVLLGAGHTNSHIIRMWRMEPIPDARLTCVSNFSTATYSGMLPGTLAGQYEVECMEIDLVRLCAASGVRLVLEPVCSLDAGRRELLFDDRPPLPFDALSIGIGSTPRADGIDLDCPSVLAIKPMQTFLPRLKRRLQQRLEKNARGPLRVAVVGAGAGGVEILFCLPNELRRQLGEVPFELLLVDAHDELVAGSPRKIAERVRRELESRGVKLLLGQAVTSAEDGALVLADGSRLDVDLALWATSAKAPELLSRFDLPQDDNGFLLTRRTLQTLADAPIFAVGDSGTCQQNPTPKAGVYAVRQGPILWENLPRAARGEPLLEYQPQSGFLSLLNTGDGRAMMSYKGLTFHAAWCWKLKDAIDRRFMAMYQDYRPMEMSEGAANSSGDATAVMRCAGCGGKVGGSVLSKVLARLDVPASEHVLLGLEQPDDAAVIQPPAGRPVVYTADFFASFMDDPYLVGRVAALNAASDLFAMGAAPLAALALALVPQGPPRKQEQLLFELLSGGLREFKQMGASLVGGHTIEGPQMTIGYSMLADAQDGPLAKGGLREGDVLVLSKPLGSGVLLAAHMQARCRGEWFDALRRVLLMSNQDAAGLAGEFNIQGMTDITGFGLAGHMLEMLRSGDLAAEVALGALSMLAGAETLFDEGLESTLAPANRSAETEIDAPYALKTTARYAALFDPQTSGGLLLGIREDRVDAVVSRLAELSDAPTSVVGRVVAAKGDEPRLKVRA